LGNREFITSAGWVTVTQTDSDTLSIAWGGSYDPESNIDHYQVSTVMPSNIKAMNLV
jgi:hypothetical protein